MQSEGNLAYVMQSEGNLAYNKNMGNKDKKSIEGQRAVLDRFEENLAVLTAEDGTDITTARKELPGDAAPGDTLVWREGRWYVDADDTQARRLRVAEKRRRLFRGN